MPGTWWALKEIRAGVAESHVQPGVEVNLIQSPEGKDETFVLCRSLGRKEKENAILHRFATRLEEKLMKLAEQARNGKVRDRQKVERQIGRLLERHSRAASLFTVTVTGTNTLPIDIKKNEERYQWAMETGGSYILRTNWTETDPKILWNTYIQLTEVEDAFRTTKHDLGMRPIFHQKQDRTQAHILVCFLALALWRTLTQWMKGSGLGTAPRKLLEGMKELKSLDVILPTREKTIRLRAVATAPQALNRIASKNENTSPQQAKDNRKCSGEKRPLFIVTACNCSLQIL